VSTEEKVVETVERAQAPLCSLALIDPTPHEIPSIAQPDDRVNDVVLETGRRRKSQIREWAESLAFTVVFILIFTSYIAQATQVPTESMKPTILVGDHFFIDKVAFPGNFPEPLRRYLPQRTVARGDIIVFKSPVEGNIPFVKRVVGMPGERIQVRDKDVYINGRKLQEPYKIHIDSAVYRDDRWTPEELKIRDNYGPHTVPPNSFFVMGDNRDNSNDSRYWGFVPSQAVMGKPLFVYWSYESDPYLGPDQTLTDWLNGYLSIGLHFFDRTRWFRIGTLVD
jgi:signal peptidase I